MERQQLKNKSENLQWTLDSLQSNNEKVFQLISSEHKSSVSEMDTFKVQAEIIKRLTTQTVKSHQHVAK